jgi:cytochrome c biogenesis protein CcmG, thiol:disulfide interchange protein DsbE
MKTVTKLLALLLLRSSLGTSSDMDLPVSLELKDLSGTKQSLSIYKGKVVVLNFWATWCEPCEEEMHEFVDANKRFSSNGVVFLAASLDDETSQKNISKFVKRQKMTFQVLTGATVEHLQKLGLGEGVPGTVILNREGKIVARVLGPISRKELRERIEWTMANNSGDYPMPVLDHFRKR